MRHAAMNRRSFMGRSLALGCSLAASPLVTPVSFAAAPWPNRLVVIILRGAMDGLDVVQPVGDPAFAALRGSLPGGTAAGAHDLNGFFALHPGLGELMPLWRAGELSFVHAVSTPYRDKRSHFDGQDMLEAGTPDLTGRGMRDGWLNRMLQQVPGIEAETAYALGHDEMLLTKGGAPVANWTPDVGLSISPQAELLARRMMADDPLFHDALTEALMLSGADELAEEQGMIAPDMGGMAEMDAPEGKRARQPHNAIARFAAEKLRKDARIAAFSLGGFDTHLRQDVTLPRALRRLSDTILTLRAEMGVAWQKTAVVAMTEFGRTARANGSRGTDHGTGGAMLLAGGALRGGQVLGDWPGLGRADLYQGRDLMPTRDVRAHAGWIMRGLYGFDRALIENVIFPGLEMGDDPGLIL
ncbi:DUF1501 domain-containing protein [Lutimaribacter sp. EGI FJ00015]|uniref:DUF1501 domain-containing protein n=1 Tax=Lutimaribacter degradans TaxID=2945989 RepID=A0ACC5ZUT3_9RHOB|nr:DUF1501 domain-containing protein [Lutimaribacter sp. EGI FJ00013]MCM2561605.1 DUF1501 domain-containing protein [Lutimaribacter sp. EGI FJ00013]MCO0612684.1 DUF1501 domain-containing protein [Lutimaribacter sp. EGI FJ00015]MCO0635342.1 DUF1501 domain-containing protein [Lutimaribacter sp. EGI FJ00014]